MRTEWLAFSMLLGLTACSGGRGGGDDEDGTDVEPEAGDEGPDEGVVEDGRSDEGADGEAREDGGEDGGSEDGTTCTRATDPLALWRERPELNMVGSGPLTRLGTLDGPCVVDGYRVVAATGMVLRFEATTEAAGMVTARLALYDARAFGGGTVAPLVDAVGAPGFTATLDATIPAGGEYLLLVHDLELRDAGPYALSASCRGGCSKRATRFPIVLLHGFGGWDTILGSLEYFYGVEDELEGQGYDVYVPTSDAVNDTPTRARQYAAQLDEILATTHARKVDFITHSQGGLDARYIVSTLGYGDRVGAVVMISTPNDGTLVADALLGDMPVGTAVLSALFDAWGAILGGSEADTRAAFEQLRTSVVRDEFNPANPDDPRVVYWSWAGQSCGVLDFSCQAANSGEVVDPLLIASYEFLVGDEPGHGPNDGLVPVASAHWGTFQGTIPGDHWDEIGQLADSGPGGPFDHLAFYADIAARLCAAGL
ncbi:MAG: triacylglycerol lipase [Deltaproteobacteria bacterium]|nr:triacylglycerol lipase [Deltaproteobacteria bacterium]